MTVTDQLGHSDCVAWLTRFGIQVHGRFVRYTSSGEALVRTREGHMFRVPLDNPTVVRAECGPAMARWPTNRAGPVGLVRAARP